MSDERSRALATQLRHRGLEAPAMLLLYAHRPLRPLLANVAIFLSPLTRPLMSRAVRGMADGLASEEGYDGLIRELEDGQARS